MLNWNLFREMDQLHKEMDALFRGIGFADSEGAGFLPGVGTRRYPRINLREDADNFYLDALLPGIDPKGLEMNVVGNSLTLSGERPAEANEPKATWHRKERGSGKFLRTIEFPVDIDANQVEASYVRGVLQVRLPKAEAAKPKQISVKVA